MSPSKTSTAIGMPLARAKQPIDDLQPVIPVIAAVAIARQRTAAALEVGRAHAHRGPARRPEDAVAPGRSRSASERSTSQSSASYASRSFTLPRPRTAPRLEAAVCSSTARTNPSFERGAISRSTIIATTRSRWRRDLLSWAVLKISRSSAILRIVPSAAATWPCGSDRSTASSSGPVPITAPPFEQCPETLDKGPRQLAQIGQGALLRAAARVAIALAQQHRRRRAPISVSSR